MLLLERFEQIGFPLGGVFFGKVGCHGLGQLVDGLEEFGDVEFLGAIVDAGRVVAEVGGQDGAVGCEYVAAVGYDVLRQRHEAVGLVVPLVGVDHCGLAQLYGYET